MTTLLEQLNAPFHYSAYRSNYEGKCYIGVNFVVERLNEVLTPYNWVHEVTDITVDEDSVEAYGKLSIYNPERDEWISRYQLGNDTMTALRESGIITSQARMDCKKSAISDSLKKTASLFGVAADVYKNLIFIAKKNSKEYNALVAKYPNLIDTFTLHTNGIPVLPDSYKAYYEEKDWEGIFKSDLLAALSNAPKSENSNGNSSKGNTGNTGNKNKTTTSNSSRSNSTTTSKPATQSTTATATSTSSNGSNTAQPTPFRALVNSSPVINQDKSSTFMVMLEDRTEVKVIAHKNLYKRITEISLNEVINFYGWLSNNQIRIAHTKGISSEKKPA